MIMRIASTSSPVYTISSMINTLLRFGGPIREPVHQVRVDRSFGMTEARNLPVLRSRGGRVQSIRVLEREERVDIPMHDEQWNSALADAGDSDGRGHGHRIGPALWVDSDAESRP